MRGTPTRGWSDRWAGFVVRAVFPKPSAGSADPEALALMLAIAGKSLHVPKGMPRGRASRACPRDPRGVILEIADGRRPFAARAESADSPARLHAQEATSETISAPAVRLREKTARPRRLAPRTRQSRPVEGYEPPGRSHRNPDSADRPAKGV